MIINYLYIKSKNNLMKKNLKKLNFMLIFIETHTLYNFEF